MDVAEAVSRFSAAFASGRAEGGWLVSGDLRTQCSVFAGEVLAMLFPDSAESLRDNSHPDVLRLAPEGKSRTIKVEAIREKVVEPLSKASYSGGWRAVAMEGADRMQQAAANAFLKTLEEPPRKTVFLLMTDAPGEMLPTIVSRCRRIRLPAPEGILEGADLEAFDEAFGLSGGRQGVLDRALAAKSLAALLDALEEDAEREGRKEDVPAVRKAFFKTALRRARKWMEDGSVPLWRAVRNIDAIETAYRQCELYIGKESALALMMDRMTFP